MKRLRAFLAFCFVSPVAYAATGGIIQSPAYKECITLATSNPTQAMTKADEWLKIDNGIAAHHCRAMALYGLKRYAEAGDALGALRVTIPPDNLTLRSFVTRQASAAWINANRADAALATLDTQIGEMNQSYGDNAANAKLTAGLLLERARINTVYGKAKLATQDLDHAISLTPLNGELLLARAKAFDMLGDTPLARADVEAALTLNPDDAAARTMLTKLDQKAAKPAH